jgi:hypothetical protein
MHVASSLDSSDKYRCASRRLFHVVRVAETSQGHLTGLDRFAPPSNPRGKPRTLLLRNEALFCDALKLVYALSCFIFVDEDYLDVEYELQKLRLGGAARKQTE